MKTVITTPNKNYPFYTVMVGSDGNTLYKTGYDTKAKAEKAAKSINGLGWQCTVETTK